MQHLVPIAAALMLTGGVIGVIGAITGRVAVAAVALLAVLVSVVLGSLGTSARHQQQHQQLTAAVQHRYGLTVLDSGDLPGDDMYTLRRADGSTVRCQITGPDAAPRVDCLTPQRPTGR